MKAFLAIEIPIKVLYNIVSRSKMDNIHEITKTITHELTHLIQLAKSKKGIKEKGYLDYKRKRSLTTDENYYLEKIEIDAFAQGTATSIISYANKLNKTSPREFIISVVFPLLKSGITSMFSREVFPSDRYESMRDIFKEKSNDPKINKAKLRGWQRFNKKIYEKLVDYLNNMPT